MKEWNGCKGEKCKLWDDGFCKLSEGNHEYCKRNGESYYPTEALKANFFHIKRGLKMAKENEWEASSQTHEKCRFCDSTETYRKFSLVSVNENGEVDGTRDIICGPICFNCIKERALKGEPIR